MSEHNPPRICAIRLPGTSRARFVDAGEVEAALGDWITIDTGPGEEPGQIVVAPDQWLEPVEMDDVPTLLRRLSARDIDQIARNIEHAREMIPAVAEVVRNQAAGCFLTGLRLTLAGDALILVYHGDHPEDLDALARTLSGSLDLPVSLEQDHPGDPERVLLGGSTGLPRRGNAQTFRELLEARLDALREPVTFAPQGMPRLNSHVQTPSGKGILVAIDIRHWKATVRLDAEGEEITVEVDELREP